MPQPTADYVTLAPAPDLNLDHSLDGLLPRQDYSLPLISPYREDWNHYGQRTRHLRAREDIQAIGKINSVFVKGT